MTRSRQWLALVTLVAVFTMGFEYLAVPSAPLFGGMLGALVFTLFLHGSVRLPAVTFRLAQAVVGVTVGAMVDWDRLRALGSAWPWVLVICLATLVLSVGFGQLLRLHSGVSASTAAFASIAGGASGMSAMADDFDADDRIVTVIQYLRVLAILSTLPLVVSWVFEAETVPRPTVLEPSNPWMDVTYTVLASVAGLAVGKLLRLPSPAILGGIGVGVGFAALPVFDGAQVPGWMQAACFLLIGVQVGLKFTRATLKRLSTMMPTAFIVIALIIGACGCLGLLLSEATGVSRLDGYLATTPGGLPAVLAGATSTGGDVTFVGTVQLLRLLIVLVATPFLAGWLLDKPGSRAG